MAPVTHETMSARPMLVSRSSEASAGRPSARRVSATDAAASGRRPQTSMPASGRTAGVGPGHVGCQHAGAHDQEVLGVGAGQAVGGQSRDRGRAASCQLVAVENGGDLAGAAVEGEVGGVDRRHVGAGVGREVGDGLDADHLGVCPGRHQQEGSGAAAGKADRMHVTFGCGHGVLGERLGDGRDQLGPRRSGPDGGSVKDAHHAENVTPSVPVPDLVGSSEPAPPSARNAEV